MITVPRSRKSTQIALGGIIAALSVLFLICTGVFPFSTYILPALAGALITVVVIECGVKNALTVYAAVSLISFFTVPDREAAMMYICFFGFYPVIKLFSEKFNNRIAEFTVKILLFNICTAIAYIILIYLLGLSEIISSASFGIYSFIFIFVAGNIAFLLYDRALTTALTVYLRYLKPKYFK